jgi:hypothetical protein
MTFIIQHYSNPDIQMDLKFRADDIAHLHWLLSSTKCAIKLFTEIMGLKEKKK